VQMLSGRAFQVAGPACENARSPNFVRSRGREFVFTGSAATAA